MFLIVVVVVVVVVVRGSGGGRRRGLLIIIKHKSLVRETSLITLKLCVSALTKSAFRGRAQCLLIYRGKTT